MRGGFGEGKREFGERGWEILGVTLSYIGCRADLENFVLVYRVASFVRDFFGLILSASLFYDFVT